MPSHALSLAWLSLPLQQYCVRVAPLVLDQLVCGVLSVLRKLNLNYYNTTANSSNSNQTGSRNAVAVAAVSVEDLQPEVPMDQELFLNLVEFLEHFLQLPQQQRQDRQLQEPLFEWQRSHLVRWCPILCHEFVKLSRKWPHVSGFYRLISMMLVMLTGQEQQQHKQMREVQKVLRQYLLECLLRVEQFRDELLSVCIRMLLLVPLQVLSLAHLLPVVLLALRAG